MILLNIPLGVSGLIAVFVLLYIFATLSRRLGAVTKMKAYYRWFYVAMAAVALAIGIVVLRQPGLEDGSVLFIYHLSLLVAGLISLAVAYRYWGWLFQERTQ
ncbi:MAG TPA: hypothetical protein VJG32_03470 [Anaerolineae bacterium]|nr:hypothetical protein [Anaerolineae bacterium]